MNESFEIPDWDTVWIDARVSTMAAGSSGYGEIENPAIGIRGDRIAWLGEASDLPGPPEKCAKEVISADGQWITPGLIDCHTHLIYGGNRAREFERRIQGVSYETILAEGGGILSTVNATRRSDEGELLESAQYRAEYLKQEGVTTVEIKSGYGLNLESELRMLRVARRLGYKDPALDVVTSFLGAHALPPEYADNRSGYIACILEEMLPAVVAESLADAVDGFCESLAFSAAEIEQIFIKAQSLGLPVKLHADQLSDSGGVQIAAKYGALSVDHLEYTSVAGVKALAASGSAAVLLPGAFYTLREEQLPPVEALRKHHVPIAIATDCNPGSSPVVSILLMLNMACILFGLTPVEALAGVTRNAAIALGMGDNRGSLESGKKADLAIWDIGHPSELAYMVGANPCSGVVKDGVYFDR